MRDRDLGDEKPVDAVVPKERASGSVFSWIHANFLKWLDIAKERESGLLNERVEVREYLDRIIADCNDIESLLGVGLDGVEKLKSEIGDIGYVSMRGGSFRAALEAWAELMDNKTWRELDPRFPRVAEVGSLGAPFLPTDLKIGGVFYKMSFSGHIYLPQGYESSEWSKVFWKYWAPKYETVSDLILKAQVMDVLFEMVGKKGRVLDLACGTGLAEKWKPSGVMLYGIDLSPEMVKVARERGEVAVVGDITMPSPFYLGGKFDGAIASYVDNWLNWRQRVDMTHFAIEALRDGGVFAFNIPRPYRNWAMDYMHLFEKCGRVEVKREYLETESGKLVWTHFVAGIKGFA